MSIEEEIKRLAEIVNQRMAQLFASKEEALYDAAAHLISAGGKRLRPVMLILAAESVGGNMEDVFPGAISMELTHNFTLIHDDIMDEDRLRRGLETVHTRWGVPVAILAGDMLFSKSFELMSRCNCEPERVVKAVSMLSEACTHVSEGQNMDMRFEETEHVPEKEYLTMIEKKTGALYAASASIGALLGGCDDATVEALYNYGMKCGIGFQIYDDVLDLTAPEDLLGKDWGSDLRQGKKTLIAIHAIEHGLTPFLDADASSEQISEMIEKLTNLGSISYVEDLAKTLVEEAKGELAVLDESGAKDQLVMMADYMLGRKY